MMWNELTIFDWNKCQKIMQNTLHWQYKHVRMTVRSSSMFPIYFLTWTGSGRSAPPLPWSGHPPGYPLRPVINDTKIIWQIFTKLKLLNVCLFCWRHSCSAPDWKLISDNRRPIISRFLSSSYLIVALKIIIFLRTIYIISICLICFSFSNPLWRGFDKYWKLLLLLFE